MIGKGFYKKICFMEKLIIEFRDTFIGRIGIAEVKGKIVSLISCRADSIGEYCLGSSLLIQKAFKQLEEYFEGKRRIFSIPLNIEGTFFMKKVWNELLEIDYGMTCTYEDIAKKICNPKAFRAVGNANRLNPLCIFIPCHRVIPKNGGLGGYALGMAIKEKLLHLEKSNL